MHPPTMMAYLLSRRLSRIGDTSAENTFICFRKLASTDWIDWELVPKALTSASCWSKVRGSLPNWAGSSPSLHFLVDWDSAWGRLSLNGFSGSFYFGLSCSSSVSSSSSLSTSMPFKYLRFGHFLRMYSTSSSLDKLTKSEISFVFLELGSVNLSITSCLMLKILF